MASNMIFFLNQAEAPPVTFVFDVAVFVVRYPDVPLLCCALSGSAAAQAHETV